MVGKTLIIIFVSQNKHRVETLIFNYLLNEDV